MLKQNARWLFISKKMLTNNLWANAVISWKIDSEYEIRRWKLQDSNFYSEEWSYETKSVIWLRVKTQLNHLELERSTTWES